MVGKVPMSLHLRKQEIRIFENPEPILTALYVVVVSAIALVWTLTPLLRQTNLSFTERWLLDSLHLGN